MESQNANTDLMDMGRRVAAWGAPLGFTDSALRGGCVIANGGGEIRYYVRRTETGIVVTNVERSSSEVFEMTSHRVDDCERFLVSLLGQSVRSRVMRGAFALRFPYFEHEAAAPFTLHTAPDLPRHVTVSEDGQYRARFASSPEAVRFTHYANAPVDELTASFLDTTGSGLFPLDPTRFASGHRVTPTT